MNEKLILSEIDVHLIFKKWYTAAFEQGMEPLSLTADNLEKEVAASADYFIEKAREITFGAKTEIN